MRLMKLIVGMLAIASSLCAYSIEKTYKATVAGGFLNGGKTSITGLAPGDEVSVSIDWGRLSDTVEFGGWSYTPAGANLGESFNQLEPWTTATMPSADVKFTANYVIGFAACLGVECEMVGEADPGDLYWSVDNGKMLIPIDREFPGKAGKVTVKFYDKTGNWRASDVVLSIDKRGTYKEDGVTYYEPAKEIFVHAKFVPSASSTKVKLDSNGGNVTREEFFAHGCEYGNLGIPYRKGYVFAGWWTAKNGGEYIARSKIFDPADFAGQRTPTIYAHWLKLQKLTLKDESAWAEWYIDEEDFDPELYNEIMNGVYTVYPDFEGYGYLEGKGVIEVLPGARVSVGVDDYIYDKSWNEFVFQKWTVTPSKANLGPDFRVSEYNTELTMPSEDITLQATYLKEGTYGFLAATVNASPAYIGDGHYIAPPFDAFEWSPDGGKTWYKATQFNEDYEYIEDAFVMLKTGSYTVTWRSTDPKWMTSDKSKIAIYSYCYMTAFATFTYVPQVVIDVMTFEGGECKLSSAGGSATMNPKDGLVPHYKTIALAAKAAKNYVFQGWAFRKNWEYGDDFRSTLATWKLENESTGVEYNEGAGDFIEKWLLESNIDPDDRKVHVVAVFKAIGSYSVDDMGFTCVATGQGGSYNVSDNVVDVNAVVGCAVEDSLCCVPATYPLSYKLDGKLPDGLKFDAKTGVLSGVPKKVGNSTVKIVASDPAKNSKGLTVNISVKSLPSWLVGDYRGLADEGSDEVIYHGSYYHNNLLTTWYPWSGLNGLLELSVKSDGKVSGKVVSCLGSGSVSGTLIWRDPACSYGDESKPAEYGFYSYGKDAHCYISFCSDGTISGDVGAFNQQYFSVHGKLAGLRQNKDLLADSGFIDKYYTFAFCPETTEAEARWDEDLETWVNDKAKMQSGYGYLTVKTDKNGTAKVIGQLPDGEKVSMSALVMPVSTNGSVRARLYLFASPSSYKKEDWFVMMLNLNSDGSVESEERSAWTIPATSAYKEYYYGDGDGDGTGNAKVLGEGALYSEAKTLEGYYWAAFCEYSDQVRQQYSYKEDGWTYYDDECALDVGYGFFFNVAVKGDSKGAISLVNKSPAPWVEDGEWNYWEDKKDNEITDPSQLSISFTKATGIFTGKAMAYFDYPKPTSASLPYAGVMIDDGEGGYVGLGAAVHTYKYSYTDDYGKTKSDTKKVSLPVSLNPVQ